MFRATLYFALLLCCSGGVFQLTTGFVIQEMQSERALEISSCYDAMRSTRRSGLYDIVVRTYSNYSFTVACDDDTHYGGWTVIQRRFDGSVDFYRTWADYRKGFGDLRGEFFIGLDKLYAMTSSGAKQELLIVMKNNRGEEKYAHYSSFVIGAEKEQYMIKELGYKTNNSTFDALSYHKSQKFSTKDNDVDKRGCAAKYKGGWWYNNCYYCDLNGVYGEHIGITWKNFDATEEFATLTFTKMMIRPVAISRENL